MLVLLAGCGARSIQLGKEWAPLSEIREAGWVADGMVTTIAPVVYVGRIQELSPGVLTHERVHAVEQTREGAQWFVNYLAFPRVRWDCEKRAWEAEIAYWHARGADLDPEYYAKLASERYFGMVSYGEARSWFQGRIR